MQCKMKNKIQHTIADTNIYIRSIYIAKQKQTLGYLNLMFLI